MPTTRSLPFPIFWEKILQIVTFFFHNMNRNDLVIYQVYITIRYSRSYKIHFGIILYVIIPLQPTRQCGELYTLDNRVVEIYTCFHFVFRFLLIGLFFPYVTQYKTYPYWSGAIQCCDGTGAIDALPVDRLN